MPGHEGKAREAPQENGSQKWFAINREPLQKMESSLVLISLYHEKTWKGTGILSASYCWYVHIQRTGFWSTSQLLLADLLTEHVFKPQGLAL